MTLITATCPSRLSDLPYGRPWHKFACKNKYFAYYKKKIMRKSFHWQAFYYWRNYTTQQITSSPLEFGTRIPIRILEDFWSEFLIIFIEKKKKYKFEVWLQKLFIKTAGSVYNPNRYSYSFRQIQWNKEKYRYISIYKQNNCRGVALKKIQINFHSDHRLLSVAFWKILTALKNDKTCYNLTLNSFFTNLRKERKEMMEQTFFEKTKIKKNIS